MVTIKWNNNPAVKDIPCGHAFTDHDEDLYIRTEAGAVILNDHPAHFKVTDPFLSEHPPYMDLGRYEIIRP